MERTDTFSLLNKKCVFTFGTLVLMSAVIPGCLSYNKTLYAAVEAENSLMRDLFNGYDSRVRPVMKPDETVNATFGIQFKQLLSLHDKEQYVESNVIISMSWHDGRLAWNTSNYMGIESIVIPTNQIWKPDIVSYTSIDLEMRYGDLPVHVKYSGQIYWHPLFYLRSQCLDNLWAFPFDKQVCSMTFASQLYSDKKLNLTYWDRYFSLDVKDYRNVNWALVSQSITFHLDSFSCCTERFTRTEIKLEFRRNPDFYVHMFVVPALLLGIIVPVTFLIPPESKERVTIGSIVMLSIILLEAKLCDVLPTGHSQPPALSIFYTLTFLWTLMSLCCSILVLNLHNRGPRKSKVPDSVRWIFLRSLRRLVCLSYYPLSDTDVINMTISRGQDMVSNSGLASTEPQACPSTSKLEKDVGEIARQIVLMSSRLYRQDNQEIVDEWRQVALVIDRLLFLFFFLVFFICSLFLLA